MGDPSRRGRAHGRTAPLPRPFGSHHRSASTPPMRPGSSCSRRCTPSRATASRPSRSRWSGRLHADSADHAALLGLATLARLTYDYPASDRLYARLVRRRLAASRRLRRLCPARPRLVARGARAERRRGRGVRAGATMRRAPRASRPPRRRRSSGSPSPRGPTEGMAVAWRSSIPAGPLIPASALDLQAERGWRRAMIRALLGRSRRDGGSGRERRSSPADRASCGSRRRRFAVSRRVLDWRGQEDSALAAFERGRAAVPAGAGPQLARRHPDEPGQPLPQAGRPGRDDRGAARSRSAEGELSHNLWAVASAHTGLGVVAMQLNDLPAAAQHLHQAVTMFEAQGDRSSAMNARKFLPLIALAERRLRHGQAADARGAGVLSGDRGDAGPVRGYRTLATIAIRERDWAGGRARAGRRAGAPPETRWSAVGRRRWRTTRGGWRSPAATWRRRSGRSGAFSAGLDSAEHLPPVRRAPAPGGHLRRAPRSRCGRARGRRRPGTSSSVGAPP